MAQNSVYSSVLRVWRRDGGGSCFDSCGYARFMFGAVRTVDIVSTFETCGGRLRAMVFCEAGLEIAVAWWCSSCRS
jgi:hypothetical protein